MYYLLEREGVILWNEEGFIWVETLVSLHVVIVIMTIAIPIYTTIQKENQLLHERSVITLALFNELQVVLNEDNITVPLTFDKKIDRIPMTFTFKEEEEFIKGCVTWKNAKNKGEKRCLYGIPS